MDHGLQVCQLTGNKQVNWIIGHNNTIITHSITLITYTSIIIERSGAWSLDECVEFTPNKVESGSEDKEGGGGYTAKYKHLAHFGILFVNNNA